MTIQPPVDLGTIATAASATGVLAVSGNVASGSLIIVAVSYANVLDTLSSVADDAGNVYAVVENDTGTGIGVGLAYCRDCLALSAGQHITATFGGSVANIVSACSVANASASAPLDTSGHSSTGLAATSATPASTGTLGLADAVVIGIVGNSALIASPAAAGFTQIDANFTVAVSLWFAYQVVAATTSVSWPPTWANPANYASAVFSFKGITVDTLQAQAFM